MSANLDTVINTLQPNRINESLAWIEDKQNWFLNKINWGCHKVSALMGSATTSSIKHDHKLEPVNPYMAKLIGAGFGAGLYFIGSWLGVALSVCEAAKMALNAINLAYYKLASRKNEETAVRNAKEISKTMEALRINAESFAKNIIRTFTFKINGILFAVKSILFTDKAKEDLSRTDIRKNLFIGFIFS